MMLVMRRRTLCQALLQVWVDTAHNDNEWFLLVRRVVSTEGKSAERSGCECSLVPREESGADPGGGGGSWGSGPPFFGETPKLQNEGKTLRVCTQLRTHFGS